MKKIKNLDFNDYFVYRDGKLYHRFSRGGAPAGSEAGADHGNGYVIVGIEYSHFYRHRIVWEMFNGPIPDGLFINHINGIRGDDRIENLELVTQALNNSSIKRKNLNVNNTSGVAGVYYCNTRNKWKADIIHNGRKYCLGSFDLFEDAVVAREQAEKEIASGKNPRVSVRARADSKLGEKYIYFDKSRNAYRVKYKGKLKQFRTLQEAINYRDSLLSDEDKK